MTSKRRKPVEALRIPLNCLIAPATKEWLTGIQNKTGESQGEIIDRFARQGVFTAEPQPRRKMSRRETAIQERAASDQTAREVGRDNIDYSDVDSSPTTHVATLDAVGPKVSDRVGKVTTENWRAGRKPLLKPSERK